MSQVCTDLTRLYSITFPGSYAGPDDENPIGQAVLEAQEKASRTLCRRMTPIQLQQLVARIRSVTGREPSVEDLS